LCWIISKTASIEKDYEESRLNVATEIAKYLSQQESRKTEEADDKELKANNKDEVNISEEKQPTSVEEEHESKTRRGSKSAVAGKGQMPLKSILHQPTQNHQSHFCQEQVDYFKEYRKYPHVSQPRPTQLSYQNHSFKDYQEDEKQTQILKQESDEQEMKEDIDQLVEDYNNNNRFPGPMAVNYNYYTSASTQWDQIRLHHEYSYPQYKSSHYINPPIASSAPIVPIDQMTSAAARLGEMSRVLSPTPPPDLNLASPNSPLLYEQRIYQGYGSANGHLQQYPVYR